jgi:putative hydrolase of the HAD superfamily
MKNIKLVIIDLDDTIYSEYDYVQSGFVYVAEHISSLFNYPVSTLVEKMNHYFKINKKDVFNNLIDFLQLESKLKVEKCIELYKFHIPSIKPYDDFFEFCRELDKNSIDLVLLTDGDLKQQKNKVIGLGINKYFKSIYYSDFYGINFRKPNPKIYLEIMSKFKVDRNEILVIGDNPNKDFLCKKTLGVSSIQIIRPNAIYANASLYLDNVKPDRVIQSLADIRFT